MKVDDTVGDLLPLVLDDPLPITEDESFERSSSYCDANSEVQPKVLLIDCNDRNYQVFAAFFKRRSFTFSQAESAELGTISCLHDVQLLVLEIGENVVGALNLLKLIGGVGTSKPVLILVADMNDASQGEVVLRVVSHCASLYGLNVLSAICGPFGQSDVSRLFSSGCFSMLGSRQGISHLNIGDVEAIQRVSEIGDCLTLMANSCDIPVNYQPRVLLSNGRFCGCEVLLDDVVAGLGPLSPSIQVDQLRRIGRIADISWRILEQALVDAVKWQKAGEVRPITLNWPREMLAEHGNLNKLSNMVRNAGLLPENVILELSENEIYFDNADIVSALLQLRLAGFGIALDDFGCAHANLQQLSLLPVTEVKIDKFLIAQIAIWPRARILVKQTVAMCHRLGLDVVAEGAESEEQIIVLQMLGCNSVQGHFISRKMSSESFPDWLHNWENCSSISESGAWWVKAKEAERFSADIDRYVSRVE